MAASTFALLILSQIYLCTSTTFYVDPGLSTSGPRSGLSWTQAFRTLDSALSSAQSSLDSVWLKRGFTYTPTNPQDRSDCFVVSDGVKIYGGFAGTESNLNQRPTSSSYTIISGDIGVADDDSDNCYHVLQYTSSLTLDSVVLEHGNANYNVLAYSNQSNTLHRYGGALITSNVAQSTFLNLRNVVIRNNTAINGGALWIASTDGNNVDVIIKDSTFEFNRAIDGVYEGGYGGAIYDMFLANLTIFNTQFNYNQAAFRGGAIYQDYGGLLHTDGCTFTGNSVGGFGGAIFSEDRNSQTEGTFPNILASTFQHNYAGVDGGAIYWYNGVIGTLSNNQFISNVAQNKGGAIALINAQSTSTGNTFTTNTANANSTTNDEFSQPDFEYIAIDDTLTFDLSVELSELYTTWSGMQTEADLYPFDSQDSLCHVDSTNTNPGLDGSSWGRAFNYIQDCLHALSVSGGGEIWVKTGTHIPTVVPQWKLDAGEPDISMHRSFVMYDNIRMYGGFAGTETSRSERNWRDNPTYLSCQQSDQVQCSQIVNSADNTLIDGFIFTNAGTGVAPIRRRLANSLTVNEILSSTAPNSGSGIWSNSTTVSVVNCIFHKLLSTGKGGGVYCIGLQGETTTTKSPTLINVAFLGNRAAQRGGAIAADVECDFVCKSCKFDSNSCSKKGGAIYLDFDSDPTLIDTVFSNNYALESGGCIAEDGLSFTTFNGSATFDSNYAVMEGGCLYSGSGVGISIEQGFSFRQVPTFSNNYMFYSGVGQSDIYGWPYSVFKIVGATLLPTTSQPSTSPTVTGSPTKLPTTSPTLFPSPSPTRSPTTLPTTSPTLFPSATPSRSPTALGETWDPTVSPSNVPSVSPTLSPTSNPSAPPALNPSVSPTANPSTAPSVAPTSQELTTMDPIMQTTKSATNGPTQSPEIANSSHAMSIAYILGYIIAISMVGAM